MTGRVVKQDPTTYKVQDSHVVFCSNKDRYFIFFKPFMSLDLTQKLTKQPIYAGLAPCKTIDIGS